MARQRVIIIGAGGFAREVEWLISDINRVDHQFDFIGFVVSDLSKLGEHDSRDRVLGDFDWLSANQHLVDSVAMGVGSPSAKLRLASSIENTFPSLDWPALVHPTVQMDFDSCEIERGVVLAANVVATVRVQFHAYTMVNLSCTVGHEAIIGRGCVLNPTVNISGGVTLAEGVLVGTGAQILQYCAVGAHATVGAGALVNKDVDPGVTVAGVPARLLPARTESE